MIFVIVSNLFLLLYQQTALLLLVDCNLREQIPKYLNDA